MSNFRITPIGTCRIHTPLKRATSRYPIELDLRRNYGFVHTSDEALQQLRFLMGEKQFRPEVEPLVFRMADPVQLGQETWEPGDLQVVEISSAKRLTFGDDIVQSNYVARHFADFFANRDRARAYWTLVKKGHRGDLREYLEKQPSYRLLSEADQELLVGLSLQQQSFKAIKADMAEFVERLGREKVLFLTHVNAETEDGAVIPSRDRLIRWVKLAAEQLEAPVFDPTPAMLEFTQERALEKGGRDLTHYTLSFSDRLFDELHRTHIGAIAGMEAPGEQGEDARIARVASQLEALLGAGDFIHAAREIHAALDNTPDALPLIELRGLVRSRIGDFQGAMEDFSRRTDQSALSPPMRTGLAEALSATGDHQGALEVVEKLLEDEYESADIYRVAAHAAKQLGRSDDAIRHAKQAYRRDRGDLSNALEALKLLTEAQRPDETIEWRREILENIGDSSSGWFETCMWAVQNHDDALFDAALKKLSEADKGATIDLLEDAWRAGMYRAFADAIPTAVAMGRLAPSLAERRTVLFAEGVGRARALFDEGQIDEAFHLACGFNALPEKVTTQIARRQLVNDARPLVREMKGHFRTRIYEAHAAGDSAQVIAIGQEAHVILLEDPDLATIVARALSTSGDEAEALALLKEVSAHSSPTVKLLRWTGNLAARTGDLTTAIRMYSALRGRQDTPANFTPEIETFFGRAERLAIKRLRLLLEDGEANESLQLSGLIERHFGRSERLDRLRNRLFRLLRDELKDIEQGDTDSTDMEKVLRQIVQLRPDDLPMLRRLAVELMRQFRFAESAEYWEAIYRLDPNNESAARNRVRCATLAEKRSSISGAELEPVG